MYMSRIRLQSEAAKNKEFWQSLGNDYQIHRSIWSLFADNKERERDFLYRREDVRGLPTFYCVSARKPEDHNNLWEIESKSYEPIVTSDQRLSFVLCANPINTKRDAEGKQHRNDVIMEAKTRLKSEGTPRDKWPHDAELVQSEGFKWLNKRAENLGFVINEGEIRADGYRQQRFYKPKGKNYVNISTVDFTGILTIIEPERFKNTLFQGIGHSKGFGCGLLMVKRL